MQDLASNNDSAVEERTGRLPMPRDRRYMRGDALEASAQYKESAATPYNAADSHVVVASSPSWALSDVQIHLKQVVRT